MAEHPRVCSRGRCARSWAGAHVLCTCSATAPSEVGEPWRSVTPAGDTGTAPPRSTTRVRRAPSLVQGARGVRARAPSVHRAYSTQQSSVVMHTHVHTHTHICCARRGACTRRLCTHTHAQGSARALVPPVAVHTDTHACPVHRAVQREPLTRAEPVHTGTHTPTCVRPACTHRAFTHVTNTHVLPAHTPEIHSLLQSLCTPACTFPTHTDTPLHTQTLRTAAHTCTPRALHTSTSVCT